MEMFIPVRSLIPLAIVACALCLVSTWFITAMPVILF